jgi:hypothetical protein
LALALIVLGNVSLSSFQKLICVSSFERPTGYATQLVIEMSKENNFVSYFFHWLSVTVSEHTWSG